MFLLEEIGAFVVPTKVVSYPAVWDRNEYECG
jgi:hypothetical protein